MYLKKITIFIILLLLSLSSVALGTPYKSFATFCDDFDGVDHANVTLSTYSWDATDTYPYYKCVASSGGTIVTSSDYRTYFYDLQTAQVLFKAPDGISDHIIVVVNWLTTTDGTGYYAFFGKDDRCGAAPSYYLATEKSGHGISATSECIADAGADPGNCLFDCKLITFDPTKVYLLKVTSRLRPYVSNEINTELFSVVGDVYTPIAKSQYIDTGSNGSIVYGERSGFLNPSSETIYFDSFYFRGESNNNLDALSNVEYYNLEDKTAGAVGYAFGTFQGNYLYPAPCYGASANHGIMARYDRSKRFDTTAGWETYDVATNIDTDMKGYHGASATTTDVYYAPLWLLGGKTTYGDVTTWELNDTVAKYSISNDFTIGWSHFHLTNIISTWVTSTAYIVGDVRRPTVGTGWWYIVTIAGTSGSPEPTWPTTLDGTVSDGGVTWKCTMAPKGYVGNFKAGKWMYFVPYGMYRVSPASENHGIVVRYDTTLPFGTASSWEVYDIANLNGNNNLRGYHLGCTDDTYAYFAPYSTDSGATNHGRVVRHKISEALNTGWEYGNLTALNSGAKGLYGCTVYSDYVYFPSNITKVVSRFKRRTGSISGYTENTFTASNWQFQDITTVSNFPAGATVGYAGADSLDGYAYFAPDFDVVGYNTHGWVARHDVTSQYLWLGWEFMNLKDKDTNLDGHHGLVFDYNTYDFYMIPDRHTGYVFHGYFSRHKFKPRGNAN